MRFAHTSDTADVIFAKKTHPLSRVQTLITQQVTQNACSEATNRAIMYCPEIKNVAARLKGHSGKVIG
jgi:hypothetical protein